MAWERKGSVIYVNSSPMISWVIDRLVCSWGNANLINSMMDNLRRWCHNVILLLISINFCNKCPNYDVKIISKVRWKVWNLHYNSFGITHRMLCFFFVSNLGPFRILSSLSWLGVFRGNRMRLNCNLDHFVLRTNSGFRYIKLLWTLRCHCRSWRWLFR